jgi:WD40 repeat protein
MRERISTDNVVKLIELTQVESDGIGHIVWSPDGTVFAVSGTRTARLYVGKFGSDPAHVLDTKVNGIAFSPDSKRMVSVGDNGAVKIWDISFIQFEIKECLSLAGHTGPVNTVVFSPDGKRFATGGADGLICIWNGTDDKPLAIFKGHERAVKSVDFAIRGNVLVSGGEEDNIRLWDAIAETEGTVFATHNGGVCDLCSNPPGTMIASAGCDGSVRLWDVLSGEQYAVIKGHDGGVN